MPPTVTHLDYCFSGNTNEKILGIENWDLSNITSLKGMFQNAENFNQDISKWNVSNVKLMSSVFKNAQNLIEIFQDGM